MEGKPLYKRPWFYIVAWLFILLIAYAWDIVILGGFRINEVRIFIDLACLFPMLLVIWMAFFSQFVLPLRTIEARLNIFSRVIGRMFGSTGPAIFIRNGELVKEEGEERRQGAGVLWLDSASAAVTRTATKIKRTLGPGVHFIDQKESIAGTVDLHIQSHRIGPMEKDNPFANKIDGQSDDEYKQIQDRRRQVGAWTRDGIEVVPNISVTFRIDTGFPEEGQPGSRFGYRTGFSPRDRKNEIKDQVMIQKAILGEGINPNYKSESPRHRVAWNQLPAALAVDVWREYASKFTLHQFFEPRVLVPPPTPMPIRVTEEEIDQLTQAIQIGAGFDALQSALARMLRVINLWIHRRIAKLEQGNNPPAQAGRPHLSVPASSDSTPKMKTAFEAINEMVKARLTQEYVPYFDETGRYDENHPHIPSREYRMLENRGLRVMNVSVSTPRLPEVIDKSLLDQWQAKWLEIAKKEKEQIERMRSLYETAGQEQAIRQYGQWLGAGVTRAVPADIKGALKTLLTRSKLLIIRNDNLRRKMSTELQELEDLLRWIEVNGR